MNYRHAFHAGNFADVLKHAVFALILDYLGRKEAPFRVIDTHAGVGLYDLGGDEAQRTGEWAGGLGRVEAASPPAEIAALLAPWRGVVEEVRQDHGPSIYPGSPELARRLTRRQDRLVFIEKHPVDAGLLAENMRRDARVKAIELDGWVALNAYVPPKERRGVVLIDPPFEEPGELARMARALAGAYGKWRTGVYVLWYPIKDRRDTDRFAAECAAGPAEKILRLELMLNDGRDPTRLNGSGLLVVNPPWTLARDGAALLPWLAATLGGPGARGACEWLAGGD
ncbi:23S rRNA (adenine(2030)-N(6))-methyltransferase RlmJ [Alsobacter sp. SYSU M60028]|uniref:Ribosomal RNA large subunit methyltransferase J n=1 Tax=Alsobacter ponti TaxID=2962936 RepID=A0ABT1L7N9_9HYPH|nr:23S rRNA (adenine(2030)-N(6))-methyltransferase RlmJ [Alsobacter ponti]MCP8937018.1 23S rRNA (adenine(2030)-N(6))-methyltransferase RlmJ [Alsobacter ponti]